MGRGRGQPDQMTGQGADGNPRASSTGPVEESATHSSHRPARLPRLALATGTTATLHSAVVPRVQPTAVQLEPPTPAAAVTRSLVPQVPRPGRGHARAQPTAGGLGAGAAAVSTMDVLRGLSGNQGGRVVGRHPSMGGDGG